MPWRRRRLPPDRAEGVELQLRARAEQMSPTEQVRPDATPLGLCHACAKIIYAGDLLAMSGAWLFHDGCAPRPSREGHPQPRD